MKYEELTINECLDLVNETLFLPDIQRPYVWEEADIYLLFDSVSFPKSSPIKKRV